MTRSRRLLWAVVLGAFLLQVAWALATPAFRGIDEFDHAYKAYAVAHGEWYGAEDPPAGRGQLLSVSPELQRAAQSWCRTYDYTEPDDCRVVSRTDDGLVRVSSAAASYVPVYYAVVGQVTHVLDGTAALVVMRLVTAALCSALLGLAAATTARWARSGWPLLALATGATPVLLYSGSVVAPNGVGYAAACLWWAAACGVVSERTRPWGLLAGASVVLLCTHTTNLLWLAVMVVALLVLRPVSSWVRDLRTGAVARAAVLVAATAVACLSWVLAVGTNRVEGPPADVLPLSVSTLVGVVPAWWLGGIGAFPLRNDPAPGVAYGLWAVGLAVVLGTGLVRSAGRLRLALGIVAAAWVVAPVLLTVSSYEQLGLAWQGRYALPLVLGLPALCGLALDRRGQRLPRPLAAAVLACVAAAHVVCVLAVLRAEAGRGLSWTFATAVPGGPTAGTVLVGALAVAGCATVLLAAASRAEDRDQDEARPAPSEGASVR